jgi:hypothetical protein
MQAAVLLNAVALVWLLLFPEVSFDDINLQFSVSNTVLQLSLTPLFQVETPKYHQLIGVEMKLSTPHGHGLLSWQTTTSTGSSGSLVLPANITQLPGE